VRQPADLNAFFGARLGGQLAEATVTARRKRFVGGALSLPASPAAPPTAAAAQRLLLQSEQVARQLSLESTIAGPGTV
jgi:hypothetical protein